MNMVPSILEACEYRMQTAKLLNSYITEMAENSISKRLIFKIFWGGIPPHPPTGKHWNRDSNLHPLLISLTVIRYITHSEVIFKTGWKQWQINQEYRLKFLNESRIIEVKQDRSHESWTSNDSASTPESEDKVPRNFALKWEQGPCNLFPENKLEQNGSWLRPPPLTVSPHEAKSVQSCHWLH